MKKITIAIQTHNFQRRLCWMLSSILEQKGDIPQIETDIAFMEGNGDPTTRAVIEHFQKLGMQIKTHPYPDLSRFQFRGYTRNDQLKDTDSDWMLFADSDMVYPDNYFAELNKLLQLDAYKDSPKCLFSGRHSIKRSSTVETMMAGYSYPCYVEGSFALAAKCRMRVPWPAVGAGYCQIVNVDQVRKLHDGIYVKEGCSRDWSWERRLQKARSDKQFRQHLGREELKLPVQIHLQHLRDSAVKYHLEDQR
jgi:hypothetical protein